MDALTYDSSATVQVNNFAITGGDDYKRLVHNVLKKLLAKSVAVTYSLFSRKGKLKFRALTVYSAIIGKTSLPFKRGSVCIYSKYSLNTL